MIRHERDKQNPDKHDNCPVLLDFQARLRSLNRHGKELVRIRRAACGECAGEHVELIFMSEQDIITLGLMALKLKAIDRELGIFRDGLKMPGYKDSQLAEIRDDLMKQYKMLNCMLKN